MLSDDFDIIGACFRTCVLNDPATQQIDDNTDLKLAKNKKRPMTVLTVTRPFLYGLKPKRISFLPATSINKMVENQIRTGRKASCCNKTYREPRKELATLVGVTKKSNYHDFETCPGHSLPEHHLLQSLAKKMRQQEEDISGRQNTPRWSGYQPYCVGILLKSLRTILSQYYRFKIIDRCSSLLQVNLDVQCEELSQPRNGFFYYCYNYAGLSCAVGCQSGYR